MFVLFQHRNILCDATYPGNLFWYKNPDVGYSGYEVGLALSYAATALGITSLERSALGVV